MTPDEFSVVLAPVTEIAGGQPFDAALQARLDLDFGAGSAWFAQMFSACQEAIAAGWMCNREAGGIRYGRVLKPGAASANPAAQAARSANVGGGRVTPSSTAPSKASR